MNFNLKIILPFVFIALFSHTLEAKIKLPALFSNHMVLQQSTGVKVWGWASPGENITFDASWLDETISTVTDADSVWKVQITTPSAGGPYTISLIGENTIYLTDILIGEVWVCSGQSNMEKPIGVQPGQKPVFNAQEEINGANYPNIRLFHVPRKKIALPQTDIESNWEVCTPQSIDSIKFSAAAYFFGRELNRQLNVPIGLIDASWGGTRIEPWIPIDGLAAAPVLDSIYQVAQKVDDSMDKRYPTLLYNGMIAPLTNYPVKGVIWYQGESNLMDLNDGLFYEEKMKAMINGWRKAWNINNLPFYYVQIAPYRYFKDRTDRVNSPNELPLIWEAQTNCLAIPHTGMVVTTDLVDDLSDIHPRNKQDVGKRLAFVALSKTYQKDEVSFSGPKYQSMKIDGNKIILTFDYIDGGLISTNNEALNWFTIAGNDKIFVPAKAEIKENKVIVYNLNIENPKAVRFAWDEEAQPNFFNANKLPAIPFRTDNWDMIQK